MRDRAPWITYRPELKVLDCTIRDGGLANDHLFSDEIVRAVYETCIAAGIDFMEVGYKNSPRMFPKDSFGPWRHCDEVDLNRVFEGHDAEKTGVRLTAMADAEKREWKEQLVPCEESVLDMIRVAFYAHQVSEAVEMIEHASSLGYDVSANLMAVSNISETEIDTVLDAVRPTPASVLVIVDSFGHMYREQIDMLYNKYAKAMEGTGKEIGIHAHNNLQLGFANTIEAIILGANRADATLGGLGRGAGNCPMELLLGFLRNPKFKLRPVVKTLQDHIEPLREQILWGSLLPYNITGQLNRHPRSAIKFLAGEDNNNYLRFFDDIMGDC
ncbi:MAG: aldolase catalytic domain-containing protein [Planctomycetota bacterium]